MDSVEIRFHGAAGNVTGSCFELRTNDTKVLIDCAMFQDTRSLEALTLNGKVHAW